MSLKSCVGVSQIISCSDTYWCFGVAYSMPLYMLWLYIFVEITGWVMGYTAPGMLHYNHIHHNQRLLPLHHYWLIHYRSPYMSIVLWTVHKPTACMHLITGTFLYWYITTIYLVGFCIRVPRERQHGCQPHLCDYEVPGLRVYSITAPIIP